MNPDDIKKSDMILPSSKKTEKQAQHRHTAWQEGRDRMSLTVTLRYDDSCGNGHNSFSMTGEVLRNDKHDVSGCIHDIIVEKMPDLAPLVPWHLTSSDGPMHYVANTMYHASDTDCNGRKKGEPYIFDYYLVFGNFPIRYPVRESLALHVEAGRSLKIVKVEPKSEKKCYQDLHTFEGLPGYWTEAPFQSLQEALDFKKAAERDTVEVIRTATHWSEGKESDLKAARNCAVWPDATLEQLQDRDALGARLPALLQDFKTAMESLGFIY